MKRAAANLTEILIARILPGVLSLLGLLILSQRLGVSNYGRFSTVLASSGFLATLSFGMISQTVIPHRSSLSNEASEKLFEEELTASTLFVFSVLVIVSLVLRDQPTITMVIAISSLAGVLLVFQQILQARLQLCRYGAVGLTQSGLFLLYIISWHGPNSTLSASLRWYALSQVIAIFVAYALVGFPKPRWPATDTIRSYRKIGSSFTIGNFAENGLYTGFRWLIAGIGNPVLLSVFSFSVDLVQRTVSVALNLVGFKLIPTAYKEISQGPQFRKILLQGASIGVGIACFIMFLILAVAEWTSMGAQLGPQFAPSMFLAVSIAAIVNRFKKVAIDPFAVRSGKAWTVAAGYSLGAATSLCLCALSLFSGLEQLTAPTYLTGYIIALLFTVWASSYHRSAWSIER